jgi:hypothetical protein
MGGYSKAGQFAAATGGSTQDVTVASGFGEPVAVFFWGGLGTVDGTAVNHLGRWYGAMTNATGEGAGENMAAAGRSEHNQTESDTSSRSANDACILMLDPVNDNVEMEANFNSFSAVTDGFRLDWVTNPPSAYLVNYWAFGGDVDAKVIECTTSGSYLGTSTHDCGFEPDLVIFFGNHDHNADTGTADLHMSIGIAHNGASVKNRCAHFRGNDNKASTENSHGINTFYCYGEPGTALNAWDKICAVTAFAASPNSFTLRNEFVNGAMTISALCLRFPSSEEIIVHDFTSPTTATTKSFTTTEQGDALFIVQGLTDNDNTFETGGNPCNVSSVGVATVDWSGEAVVSTSCEDGSTKSDDEELQATGDCVRTKVEGTGNDHEVAGYTSRSTTAFTITYSVAAAVARYGFAVTIGQEAAAAGGGGHDYLARHVRRRTSSLRRT